MVYILEVYIIITEVWKDVKEYEGLYQVSNLGQIRSLDRYVIRKDGVRQFKKGKIIKPIENSDGYYQLKLCKNGKSHTKRVHIIVAEHFLEKPIDYKNTQYEVNHKDFNRKNNSFDNLEYLTHIENIRYSSDKNRYKRDIYGSNNPNYNNHKLSDFYRNNPEIAIKKLSRPAEQNGRSEKIDLYDEDMNYINTFNWIGGCAIYLQNNGFTKATVNSIRTNITIAIKNNKKYLDHYYKK